MSESHSHRMDELESRLAFMDDTVEQLSTVIARQDKEIRQLKQGLADVTAKLDDLGGAVTEGEPSSQHEIPPHY